MKNSPSKVLSLDGLRAFAVVAVMLVHVGFPGFVLGGLGVDLFFALSGFLITHLFIREYGFSGRINLVNFWARRFLRLMPIYWLYLLLITGLIVFGYGEVQEFQGWSPAQYILSMWLYFVNYLPAGGIWSEQFMTIHLWSLALEEQFYLVWPLLIVMLFRFNILLKGAVLILVLFTLYCFFHASEKELLKTITGRGLTLFLGCLFAILCNRESCHRWFTSIPVNYVGLLVVAFYLLMTVLTYMGYYQEQQIKMHFAAIFGLLFCFLIVCLYHQKESFAHKLLEMSLLVYIGKISYGIYLYHLIMQAVVWQFIFPQGIFGSPIDYLWRIGLYFGFTIGLAAFSFRYIESYFLQYKDKFRD